MLHKRSRHTSDTGLDTKEAVQLADDLWKQLYPTCVNPLLLTPYLCFLRITIQSVGFRVEALRFRAAAALMELHILKSDCRSRITIFSCC